MARVQERTNQTAAVLTVDWDLRSLFISRDGGRPVEMEFNTVAGLADTLLGWLRQEAGE